MLFERIPGKIPAIFAAGGLTMSDFALYDADIEDRMSDGPHKSLPMRRHWKRLAERAWNPSYSADEVRETLTLSLKHEFRDAPIKEVQAICGGDNQATFWADERVANLEATRELCRGSAAGHVLIDCAIEAVMNGMAGDSACKHALQNALNTHAHNCCRQIEEHQYRKEPQGGPRVRARLNDARGRSRNDELSAELISCQPARTNLHLQKRSGIDEGPSL